MRCLMRASGVLARPPRERIIAILDNVGIDNSP